MTIAARAAWGAALGAILTLLLHPVSRAYLLADFISYQPRTFDQWSQNLVGEKARLAFFLTGYCDQIVTSSAKKEGFDRALAAVEKGANLDPDNAYWQQVWAVLLAKDNKPEQAVEHWIAASGKLTWNDYQSSILFAQRFDLAGQYGAEQNWQLLYLYFLRSQSTATLISNYGRALVLNRSFDKHDDLMLRGMTVQNGDLLRTGSRSVVVGNHGAQLEEVASHPSGLSATLSNHKMLLARFDLFNRLRGIGQVTLASATNQAYRELDAWDALASPTRSEEVISDVSIESLLAIGIPGVSLVIGLFGLLLTGIAFATKSLNRIHPAFPPLLGIVFAASSYAISFLPLVSLAIFGCCMFLLFRPKYERPAGASDLGPLFSFLLWVISIIISLLTALFLITSSFAGVQILSHLGVPPEYLGGSGAILALTMLFTAILLFIAPIYGLTLRIPTINVLKTLLARSGRIFCLLGALGIIISTPVGIYVDRSNQETVQQMLLNEPLHLYRNAR